MWQVRHKNMGVFMGVSHNKGHYHIVSHCCRGLGVFQFDSQDLIERFLALADGPHLPEGARRPREEFTIEPWNRNLDDLLLDEQLLDDCDELLVAITKHFPIGSN